MTPEEFLELRRYQAKVMQNAQELIDYAYYRACSCPIPDNLRPATIEDVKPGAILWYPEFEHGKWLVVESLIEADQPREPDFKWFYYEGSRYGIDGAFVEIKGANDDNNSV